MNEWINEIRRQIEENEALLKVVRKELRYAPQGRLQLSHYRGAVRFYRLGFSPDRKKEYLGEKRMAMRQSLAQKLYDEKLLSSIEAEQELLADVLANLPTCAVDVPKLLPVEVQELIEPHVLSDEAFVRSWMEEFSRNASGEKLKSRIEGIYDQYYHSLDVPHIYEPSLYLEGYGPARPDFAVLNVRTRKTLYHEHFGMMGDEEYRAKNMHKLRCYHLNGFFEGDNLIVTMESDGMMVDYAEIESIIKKYCW